MFSPCDADGGFSPGVLVQVQGDKSEVLRRITPLLVDHTLLNPHPQCSCRGHSRASQFGKYSCGDLRLSSRTKLDGLFAAAAKLRHHGSCQQWMFSRCAPELSTR